MIAPPLILASTSPRRAALLKQWGIHFHSVTPDVSEPPASQAASPIEYCIENARLKALTLKDKYPEKYILGADTIVLYEDRILGKPGNAESAYRILHMLSGREHVVVTGTCMVVPNSGTILNHEITRVTFRLLTDREITAYVDSGEPFDKAGAYGIQEKGALFVKSISGCYFNVVGLPVRPIVQCLPTEFFVWN